MIMNLRTLAMLDSGPSQVSITASKGGQATEAHDMTESRLKSNVHAPTFKPKIKRKVGYSETEEDIVLARCQINNMAMNDRKGN